MFPVFKLPVTDLSILPKAINIVAPSLGSCNIVNMSKMDFILLDGRQFIFFKGGNRLLSCDYLIKV